MSSRFFTCTLVLATGIVGGCGGSMPVVHAPAESGQQTSPLGPSYTLIPVPSDDDALLGRVIDHMPAEGQSLEEVARPNACAQFLSPVKSTPSVGTFEDAEELALEGKASATLGQFGFSGDASRATHFLYRLQTERRLARADTTEYEQCCKEKSACGIGFVSALVYGSGEYATAEETSGRASANITFVSAEGAARYRVLHKRGVHGWMAAMIRPMAGAEQAKSFGALGDPAAYGLKLDEITLPQQVKDRFQAGRIHVETNNDTPVETAYVFEDGSDEISENEFIRRYGQITHSNELDPLAGKKNGKKILSFGLLTLGSLAMLGGGIGIIAATGGESDGAIVGGGALAAAGFGLSLGFGITFLVQLGRDSPVYHRITRYDAELYAQRYNRFLLRKSIKDATERMKSLSSTAPAPEPPIRIGVTPFGIEGSF